MLAPLLVAFRSTSLGSLIKNEQFDSLRELAMAYDDAAIDRTNIKDCIGLEWHHNDSNVDIFFYGGNDIIFSSTLCPPSWKNSYLNFWRSEYNSQRFLEGHYFEIDWKDCRHRISGFFQAYNCSGVHADDTKNIVSFLRSLHNISFNKSDVESALLDICNSANCPKQIGLMLGRGQYIKLVSNLNEVIFSTEHKIRFRSFIHRHYDVIFRATGVEIDEVVRVASQHSKECNMKISLDFDLSQGVFLPSISFELSTPNRLQYRDSNAIQDILRTFRIKSSDVEDVFRINSLLPCGVRLNNSIYHQLVACVATHIKVRLSIQGPSIKSYLGVHGRKAWEPPLHSKVDANHS